MPIQAISARSHMPHTYAIFGLSIDSSARLCTSYLPSVFIQYRKFFWLIVGSFVGSSEQIVGSFWEAKKPSRVCRGFSLARLISGTNVGLSTCCHLLPDLTFIEGHNNNMFQKWFSSPSYVLTCLRRLFYTPGIYVYNKNVPLCN